MWGCSCFSFANTAWLLRVIWPCSYLTKWLRMPPPLCTLPCNTIYYVLSWYYHMLSTHMHSEEHFAMQWKYFICVCICACILYKHMCMYVYHGHGNLAFIHLVYTQVRTGPSLGWMPVTFEENKDMGAVRAARRPSSSLLPTSLGRLPGVGFSSPSEFWWSGSLQPLPLGHRSDQKSLREGFPLTHAAVTCHSCLGLTWVRTTSSWFLQLIFLLLFM